MEGILGICGMLILMALGLVCIVVTWTRILPLWQGVFRGPADSEPERRMASRLMAILTPRQPRVSDVSWGAPIEQDWGMDDRALIIVARERPELFQELRTQYGNLPVIVDRRSVPRGKAGDDDPDVCDAELARDGFTMAFAKPGGRG
jgi:hypothetical protein